MGGGDLWKAKWVIFVFGTLCPFFQLLLPFSFGLLSPSLVSGWWMNQPQNSHLLNKPCDSTGTQERRLMIWWTNSLIKWGTYCVHRWHFSHVTASYRKYLESVPWIIMCRWLPTPSMCDIWENNMNKVNGGLFSFHCHGPRGKDPGRQVGQI